MADVISFPHRARRQRRVEPTFAVYVMPQDGLWLVVARKHSWLHITRREAQTFARDVADGFSVSTVVQIGGTT